MELLSLVMLIFALFVIVYEAARWFAVRSRRFSLRDLFILTLVVSVVLAAVMAMMR